MSVQIGTLLQTALTGIFTNGLWPGQARDLCPAPYGVFNSFGETNYFLAGRAGDQRKRVQVDCYASSSSAAGALADLVQVAMDAQSLYASPTMFTSTQIDREEMGPDPDTKNHRVMLEFSVWYRPS